LSEITELLRLHQQGVISAQNALLPLVYAELKRLAARAMAGERHRVTLSPTALVHEAYLRMANEAQFNAPDRRTFFALAAQRMRQVLIDCARERQALKRGGGALQAVTLTGLADTDHAIGDIDLIALDQALTQLHAFDARRAEVVQLRYFAGLDMSEIAEQLGVSRATAQRDWDVARAFLFNALQSV
jgi:RNA polymerase sigma-70 factor, ECF subfamily